MDKHQQAQREANAAAGAAAGATASSSNDLYPAPPTYEQATFLAHAPDAPPPQSMPMPMPMPMPTPSMPPPQTHQPQYVYTNTTAGAPAPPVIHIATQHQQQPMLIVQQHGVPMPPLGPEPVFLACPFCRAECMTRVDNEPNSRTHLTALLLCVLGFWCCACFPYCMNGCMSANHYCKNCNKFLGTYAGSL